MSVASVNICAKCGKHGVGLKQCSVCKDAHYCGAACQKSDWKRHRKQCTSPVTIQDVAAKVEAARREGDWKGVLKWEGRMEHMMAACVVCDDTCQLILSRFSNAHLLEFQATGIKDHARSCAGLVARQIPLLGKLKRFRDQGEDMCKLADILDTLAEHRKAATWRQRARDVGAAHGLFSLESMACRGLGKTAMIGGSDSYEEGLALLRNGLVAAELNELDDPQYELDALHDLIVALFTKGCTGEVEILVMRFRKAHAASIPEGGTVGFCFAEFNSMLWCARIHEVISLCFNAYCSYAMLQCPSSHCI